MRTIGAQIRGKVDNFDSAVDDALEFFDVHDKDAASVEKFDQYVKLFAQDLDILPPATQPEDKVVGFADPPLITVRVDEGRTYLYLGFSHRRKGQGTTKVMARTDIDQVVGLYLSSRSEFDALALVGRDGRVITQHSSSGVELSHVERLTAGAAPPQASGTPPSATPTGAAPPATLERPVLPLGLETLRATGNIADVTIGGAAYKLYVQPVQLSLYAPDGKEPEEWSICGLVRADHFRAASSAISSTYWLMLIAALAVLCLSIPLLKIHILSARERFKGSDGVSVAAATFFAAGLLAFALLDAFYFGYAFRQGTDQQLRELSGKILANVVDEATKISAELDGRERSLVKRPKAASGAGSAGTQVTLKGKLPVCTPPEACRHGLLAEVSPPVHYPFFNLIVWTDKTGQQQVKQTTSTAITPFINIREAKLAYYDDIERAHALPSLPRNGVAVIRSPNTGEPMTIFWRSLDGGDPPDPTAVSLATTPLSLVEPLLPKDMQFAVVDSTGSVLFHSDQRRNLNENFFQECERDPALHALVLGRSSRTITASYLGERHRLHVAPITWESMASFTDPKWSLVVFQRTLVADTVNLETLTLAAALFTAYGLVLAGVWGLLFLLWRDRARKWFWPDDRKADRYRAVATWNGIFILLFVMLIARAGPFWLVAGTIAICSAAASVTFVIVGLSARPPSSRASWRRDFTLARVSFLFVIAAVPAIASFQAAYDFEMNVLARRGQLHLEAETEHRTARAQQQAQRLPFCAEAHGNCWTIEAFLERRLSGISWDTNTLPLVRPRPDAPVGQPRGTSLVDHVLPIGHIAYNDVAIDLEMAIAPMLNARWLPGNVMASAAAIHPDGSYVLVAMALALGLYALVRFVAQPLFVLDLYVSPGFKCSGKRELTGNLLLVGLPGSGKSDTLRKNPLSRIYDVMTYVAPSAPAPAQALFDTSTLPAGGVLCIDHLEYRLDDPVFRDRLLTLLEELLYTRHYCVWIASTREPVAQLRESGATTDLDRWRRVLQSFRQETVGIAAAPVEAARATVSAIVEAHHLEPGADLTTLVLAECSLAPRLLSIATDVLAQLPDGAQPARDALLFEIGVAAAPFYRALWAACSKDDKLALRQLAEEGVVNPQNAAVIAHLLRRGLVRRDPTFRVMNETFRRLILEEVSVEGLTAWEHEGVQFPWASISTMMLTGALFLVGVILLAQQQLMDAWVGYVPMLSPAVPTVLKLISNVQRDPKAAAARA